MIGTPRSALRYRSLTGTISTQMPTPYSGVRAPHGTITTGQPRVRMTEDVDELPRHMIPPRRSAQRAQYPQPSYEEEQEYTTSNQGGSRPRSRVRLHPLLWLGVGMLLVLGFWQLTTSGAAWWSTHVTDPGQYGPTQGNVINTTLGGGGSAASPTKIIALNNDGQVQLILVPSNTPAKTRIITVADLVRMHFPDPAKAVLLVQAVDDNGKTNLKITVWADTYLLPFQRYSVTFLLPGDGKGGFAQGQPA